jgi:hypothetical protein
LIVKNALRTFLFKNNKKIKEKKGKGKESESAQLAEEG